MALLALAGCGIDALGVLAPGDLGDGGASSGGPPSDASADAGGDRSGDASGEASLDALADAPADAAMDVIADAFIDVTVDAGPCAACPAGTPQSMCIANACVAVRRVFVSSTGSTANLGGVAGADGRCQTLALAAQLGGTWRAWVSASGDTPNTRFTKSTVPYRLLNGTLVADDWDDLTDGSLEHAIDRDEKNVLVANTEVWTATNSGGNFTSGGCNAFMSGANGSPTAAQGLSDETDTDWTNTYVQFCDRTTPRIYCFEQ